MSTPAPHTFERVFSIPARREAVFGALTEARQLTAWFAEMVEIQPRVGGPFRFWGKHTPWVESASLADQVLTEFEPPKALAFRWTWSGVPTVARLSLTEHSAATTLVTVTHTADAEIRSLGPDTVHLLGDFWILSIGNLRHFLRTGSLALRPDFADPDRRKVLLSIDIDAPAERVWQALTDTAQMDQWLSKSADADLVVGGRYAYGWKRDTPTGPIEIGPARVIDLKPNALLAHDWHYFDEPATRVTWRLEPITETCTRVTLLHTRDFPHDKHINGYTMGWAAFLCELAAFSERRRSSKDPMIFS